MVRAILNNGKIEALEPLPTEWRDGRELVVAEAKSSIESESLTTAEDLADLQRRAKALRELGEAFFEPGERELVQSIIDEQRQTSKEQVRRQMGL